MWRASLSSWVSRCEHWPFVCLCRIAPDPKLLQNQCMFVGGAMPTPRESSANRAQAHPDHQHVSCKRLCMSRTSVPSEYISSSEVLRHGCHQMAYICCQTSSILGRLRHQGRAIRFCLNCWIPKSRPCYLILVFVRTAGLGSQQWQRVHQRQPGALIRAESSWSGGGHGAHQPALWHWPLHHRG